MIQYRPSGGGGGRFKKRSFGDGGAAARKEKATREINALRDSSNQYQAINEAYLGDVKQVHQEEAHNKAELKQHEDNKWQTRRNAKVVRNQRDVEHLKGKAAEYGRAAKFWGTFTPTLAAGLSNTATSLNELAEKRIKADLLSGNLVPQKEGSELLKEALEAGEEDALDMAEEIQLAYKGNQKLPLRYLGLSPKHSTAYQEIFADKQKALIPEQASELILSYENDETNPTPITSDNIDEIRQIYMQRVLEMYGWENSLSPKVQELKESINAHFDSKKREMTLTEDNRLSKHQFNTMYQLAVANNDWSQETVDGLARRYRFIRKEDGTFPNAQEAYRGFLGEMAKDVNIPFERIEEILDLQTLRKGWMKQFPTIGTRDAGIREFLVGERAKAEKKVVDTTNAKHKYTEAEETKDMIHRLSNTGVYAAGQEKADMAWDGTSEERIKLMSWAKQNGFNKLAGIIESYSVYDEGVYTKGLQLKQVKDLFEAGSWEEALEMIDNTPGFTKEDREKAKAEYTEIFQSIAKAGTNEKKIEEELDSRLKQALGKEYVQKNRNDIPSLEGTVLKAKVHLLDRYQVYLDQVAPKDRTRATYKDAMKNAWEDVFTTIKDGDDYAQIETADESQTDYANFPASEPRPDARETWTTSSSKNLLKNKDSWKTEKILTLEAKQNIAEDIRDGLPIRVPDWMRQYSIDNNVSIAELINDQLAIEETTPAGTKIKFSQKMSITPQDYALAGVPPGYLGIANRIKFAQDIDEVQRISDYNVTKRNPSNIDPVVTAELNNPYTAVISQTVANPFSAKTLASIQALLPDLDMSSSVSFTDMSMSSFQITDPVVRSRVIQAYKQNPDLNFSWNPYDQHFVTEEY